MSDACSMSQDAAAFTGPPLTRCAACGSKLIYPLAVLTASDGLAIVERRCPECEARDSVSASAEAVAVWLHRQTRIRRLLADTLDSLERSSSGGFHERA
jgi:hypothetical protein